MHARQFATQEKTRFFNGVFCWCWKKKNETRKRKHSNILKHSSFWISHSLITHRTEYYCAFSFIHEHSTCSVHMDTIWVLHRLCIWLNLCHNKIWALEHRLGPWLSWWSSWRTLMLQMEDDCWFIEMVMFPLKPRAFEKLNLLVTVGNRCVANSYDGIKWRAPWIVESCACGDSCSERVKISKFTCFHDSFLIS